MIACWEIRCGELLLSNVLELNISVQKNRGVGAGVQVSHRQHFRLEILGRVIHVASELLHLYRLVIAQTYLIIMARLSVGSFHIRVAPLESPVEDEQSGHLDDVSGTNHSQLSNIVIKIIATGSKGGPTESRS